ncbi:hypothetical protein BGC_21270 [Burkholderia sp. 3C]
MRRETRERAEQFEPAAGRQAQLDDGDVSMARDDPGKRHRVIFRFADDGDAGQRFEQGGDPLADRNGRLDDIYAEEIGIHLTSMPSRGSR